MQDLPKDVMKAMELESYANIEAPQDEQLYDSKGDSTLVQENNGSIFDQREAIESPDPTPASTRQQMMHRDDKTSVEKEQFELGSETPNENPMPTSSAYTVPGHSDEAASAT